jgi:plastocyanin
MIWGLRICFSLLCAASLSAATLNGRVELRDSKEAAVRKKKDFSGVVIWLEPLNGKPLQQPTVRARMTQKDKTFSPHMLAVPTGAVVDFPNFDPIFHNVFSTYDGQPFDLALYPPRTSKSVKFTQPGIVRVFCNIHSTMSAVIAVLDTPYFDVSKREGTFELRDVPAGDYRLHLFHERATQATLDELGRRLTVDGDQQDIAPIAISESGYLPIPHLNKFGRPYPQPPDDGGVYPGVRK